MKFTSFCSSSNISIRFIYNGPENRGEVIEQMSEDLVRDLERIGTFEETVDAECLLLVNALLSSYNNIMLPGDFEDVAHEMRRINQDLADNFDNAELAKIVRGLIQASIDADQVDAVPAGGDQLAVTAPETAVQTVDYAGIARAVNGLDINNELEEFVLEGPNGNTFNIPLSSINSAEEAVAVLNRFNLLIREGYLDIDNGTPRSNEGSIIYFLEDLDGDVSELTPEALLAHLDLEAGDGATEVTTTAPLRQAATGLTYGASIGVSTGEPLDGTAEDLLPPVPEPVQMSYGEMLEAIQDPSIPVPPEALEYMESAEIIERLILFPEQNADMRGQLMTQLVAMNGGNISPGDAEELARGAHYFMGARNPQFNMSEDAVADMILAFGREAQGIGLDLSEEETNTIRELLGENADRFLSSLSEWLTNEEAMAQARTISILMGYQTLLNNEITEFQARDPETRTIYGPGGPIGTYEYRWTFEINARTRQAEAINTLMNQLLNGEVDYDSQDVITAINEAQAADTGITIATQAVDDGIATIEVTEAEQAQLDRARTFIDSFAGFRPGQLELYQRAYQALNNNDVAATEAVLEEILDASVRHWYHNFWGRDTYETGEVITQTFRSPQAGEYTVSATDMQEITAAGIMDDPSVLAQALREIEAYGAAEDVMLQATQAELTAEGAETTEAESAVLNEFHDQLFTSDGNFNYESQPAMDAAQSVDAMILRLQTIDPVGAEAVVAMRDDLIVSQASSAVFENVINGYLEAHPDNVDGLSHMMELYSDMTGVGGEWNNFSDANLAIAREAGLFVGGFLIPVGAITGMLARIGKAVNTARQAASARVVSGINRFLQMPMDEAARVRGLTTAIRNGDDLPSLMAAARTAGTNTDEVLTAALRAGSNMDEVYAAAGSMDDFLSLAARAGNRSDEMLQVAMRNGAQLDALAALGSTDDIVRLALESGRSLDEVYAVVGNMDDFIRVVAQTSGRGDEVLQFVMRQGADIDHLATLGGSFDNILNLASQSGRLDDALAYGLQSGRASIDDLYRYAGSNLDEVIGTARQAGWNADDALIYAINQGTNADRILEVARVAGANIDDIAMQAMLKGGRAGQPFNGARIAEIVRANGGNVDEFMRAAQAQGATPQILSAVGRAMGYSDDVIARVLNVSDGPAGSFTTPSMGVVDDGLGLADDLLVGGADNVVPIRPGAPARPVRAVQPVGIADEVLSLADDIPARSFEVHGRTFSRGQEVRYQTARQAANGEAGEVAYIFGQAANGGIILTRTPLDEAAMAINSSDELYRAASIRPNTFAVQTEAAVGRITVGTVDNVLPLAPRIAAEIPEGATIISLGRARDMLRGFPGVARGVADDLAPHLARMRAGVANSADDFMNAYRALPAAQQRAVQLGLGTAASAPIIALIPDLIGPDAALDEGTQDEPVDTGAVVLQPLDLGPSALADSLPSGGEVLVEQPASLAEQMEAIGVSDIRGHAEALRGIMANRIDSYQPGQWREVSLEIAEVFGLELEGETEEETEANILAFGNTMQGQIRNLLGIEESSEDTLEDDKIGPDTLRFMDRALLSVSQGEITDQTEALMNFEAQDGGWRANNRVLAALFGINFAEDATDAQLKVFGRSIQAFAGGSDGAIGPQTLGRMRERLQALQDA